MNSVLAIIIGFFIGIPIGLIVKMIRKNLRKRKLKDWQIDDVLIIKDKQKYAILTGWTLKSVVVMFDGNDYFTELNITEVKLNKSAYWRKLHKDCKETMGEGKDPKFKSTVGLFYRNTEDKRQSKNANQIHGKPIETLTETECQIYLKECLQNEEYELAELIKKQMEKYR
jgi:hypothetical protein